MQYNFIRCWVMSGMPSLVRVDQVVALVPSEDLKTADGDPCLLVFLQGQDEPLAVALGQFMAEWEALGLPSLWEDTDD